MNKSFINKKNLIWIVNFCYWFCCCNIVNITDDMVNEYLGHHHKPNDDGSDFIL